MVPLSPARGEGNQVAAARSRTRAVARCPGRAGQQYEMTISGADSPWSHTFAKLRDLRIRSVRRRDQLLRALEQVTQGGDESRTDRTVYGTVIAGQRDIDDR